jgi:hypothetical protein
VRVVGFLVVAAGAAFFGLATLLVIESGVSSGFFGALATGCIGVVGGLNLIVQAKGQMD